ncbi:MAG: hypothetical protein VX677_09010 [Candidatus Poribacteria bacterium]|nr:hypothetical protein [Candidatus Poribacteria bacterium]MEE2618741.1 hypothetical protein [Candidatus Poribacteria bacterium]
MVSRTTAQAVTPGEDRWIEGSGCPHGTAIYILAQAIKIISILVLAVSGFLGSDDIHLAEKPDPNN